MAAYILATYWQIAGSFTGSLLAAYWQFNGSLLATYYQLIGSLLAAYGQLIGNLLATYHQLTSSSLAESLLQLSIFNVHFTHLVNSTTRLRSNVGPRPTLTTAASHVGFENP